MLQSPSYRNHCLVEKPFLLDPARPSDTLWAHFARPGRCSPATAAPAPSLPALGDAAPYGQPLNTLVTDYCGYAAAFRRICPRSAATQAPQRLQNSRLHRFILTYDLPLHYKLSFLFFGDCLSLCFPWPVPTSGLAIPAEPLSSQRPF